MIKNIVFDMGNVLIKFDPRGYIERQVLDKDVSSLIYNEVFKSKEWIQYDRGVLDLEQVLIAAQKRIPLEHHTITKVLVDNWYNERWEHQDMLALVKELKERGYQLYLLSNASKDFHIFRKDIRALEFFNGEFISADYGVIKPEREIYEKFLNEFALNPKECLFIDDLAVNIEAAERVGMKGFVYHGEVERLRDLLIEEGIIEK